MSKIPENVPLSLAHLCELEVPPLQLVELAARAGFASTGLRVAPATRGGIEYPLRTAAEQTELRRRLGDNGVSVLEIELVSLSEATRVAECRPMLEVGAAIGASRLTVVGDSTDFSVAAEKLAEVSELAETYSIAVDLEFMPFRAVQSLADAIDVVKRANHRNAHIVVDALHVYRSDSALGQFVGIDPAQIGQFQICDAPAKAPPADQLVVEARTRRLLPGEGELDLDALIAALPPLTCVGVEVPLASQRPDLDPGARLKLLVSATRDYLRRRNS